MVASSPEPPKEVEPVCPVTADPPVQAEPIVSLSNLPFPFFCLSFSIQWICLFLFYSKCEPIMLTQPRV